MGHKNETLKNVQAIRFGDPRRQITKWLQTALHCSKIIQLSIFYALETLTRKSSQGIPITFLSPL